MSHTMLHALAVCVLLISVAAAPAQSQTTMIDSLLNDAQRALVPDRRTQVFDVQASLDGSTVTLRGEIQNVELRNKLVEFIKSSGKYTVADSLSVLPQASLGGKTWGVVSLSVANIRTSPENAAEMGTQATLGTTLRVLGKRRGGWFRVQTPEGYLGWSDDRIEMMDRALYERWARQPKVIVTAVYGFTYEVPDAGGQVVSDVVVGAILGTTGESGQFFEVVYPDGRSAFLPKESAMPLEEWLKTANATPVSVVATAKRFVGIPYLWGGASAKGFDCSGFAKTIYFLNGLLLPRDADQQSMVGMPVDTSNGLRDVQAGDLLFFGTKATPARPERVTHVGMSIGGPRFIHSSGDVKLNSLDPKDPDYSSYRRDMFLRARRMIGAGPQAGVPSLEQFLYLTTP